MFLPLWWIQWPFNLQAAMKGIFCTVILCQIMICPKLISKGSDYMGYGRTMIKMMLFSWTAKAVAERPIQIRAHCKWNNFCNHFQPYCLSWCKVANCPPPDLFISSGKTYTYPFITCIKNRSGVKKCWIWKCVMCNVKPWVGFFN